MSLINLIMSQLITTVMVGLAIGLVIKVFQLSTALSEIKDILTEIKRNTAGEAPMRKESVFASPSDLMRAVNSEGMDAAEAYAQSLLKPPGS